MTFLYFSPSQFQNFQSKETPVFVPPPPPPTDVMYLPRLAELKKSDPDQEFGFNLHAERNRGHFIGTVDQGGIGQAAGLVIGQRIVGVNGQLIYPNTGHKEVVALIKKDNMKTTLLVASEEVDKYHKDHNLAYSWDNVERVGGPPAINVETYHHHEEAPPVKASAYDVPPLNPHSIQVNEEREITKTKTETTHTNSYSYKEETPVYNAYAAEPASGDLMDEVFGKVNLPTVGNQVTIHSHTEELATAEDASSVSSLSSSHRESAVDVPVSHQYVPSYATQSHQQHEQHSQTHHHHHHNHNQQPSPLSNGSSHGYAASSTSGYDDDDIYHLSASEARERLRMKNRKHHLHEMSLNEKYQLVSNM
ncbi:hypothetical protein B9Z55_013023 [Caenorhabditis nigoni]|uniref:PDZ domain-containing protein n=1 Tax=Caenorhabditis nigoni TaxID=1611254 RepID=A0A2G5TZS6_9PELO|nr:hypothetical protein B9Z55_013023 [Caenorhabditis nigoni]